MAENDQNPPGEAHFNVFEDDNNPEIPLDEQGDPAASAVPAVPHYVLVQEQIAVVALEMADWQRKAPETAAAATINLIDRTPVAVWHAAHHVLRAVYLTYLLIPYKIHDRSEAEGRAAAGEGRTSTQKLCLLTTT